MEIQFSCENCGHKYKTDSINSGKKGKCKNCGSLFIVPNPKIIQEQPPLNKSIGTPNQRQSLSSIQKIKEQNHKRMFELCCLAMILTIVIQKYNAGDHNLPRIICEALGSSVISMGIWIVIGRFIIFNIILAIINLVKPENKLSFDKWEKSSAGLVIGILVKLVFGSPI